MERQLVLNGNPMEEVVSFARAVHVRHPKFDQFDLMDVRESGMVAVLVKLL